jgi:hypothetical protein
MVFQFCSHDYTQTHRDEGQGQSNYHGWEKRTRGGTVKDKGVRTESIANSSDEEQQKSPGLMLGYKMKLKDDTGQQMDN